MNTEQKRRRIELAVKLTATLVVAFFVSPFIFVAINGLIGMIAATLIGVTAVNLAPWVGMKVANWRLKAIKHEASKNPIETLQNEYQERRQGMLDFRSAIETFSGAVNIFKEKLHAMENEYGVNEAKPYRDQYEAMKQLLEMRVQKYKQTQVNLERFEKEIEKAQVKWDMAQEAAKMNRAAAITEGDFISKIQVETALGAVQKSLSISFAELEMSLVDEATGKRPELPAAQEPVQIGAQRSTLELNV